jgi:hypothetical protein
MSTPPYRVWDYTSGRDSISNIGRIAAFEGASLSHYTAPSDLGSPLALLSAILQFGIWQKSPVCHFKNPERSSRHFAFQIWHFGNHGNFGNAPGLEIAPNLRLRWADISRIFSSLAGDVHFTSGGLRVHCRISLISRMVLARQMKVEP